ncbi:MAG TPA: hypothetical protein VKI65_08895 [Gemmataceae bacterium]|nr:hypothetical protein [Gemmataceae bacterium]
MVKQQRLSEARWLAFGVFVLAGAAGLVGCGGPEAMVAGKVTYKGEPLPSGTVTFIRDGANPASGQIKADGTYVVEYAPVGDCTITVITQTAAQNAMSPAGKSMKDADNPKYKDKFKQDEEKARGEKNQKMQNVPGKGDALPGGETKSITIPQKYASPQSSPLKYSVKKGKNHFDIELTD